jgi:hypothetical protein
MFTFLKGFVKASFLSSILKRILKKERQVDTYSLDLVHSNIMGPFPHLPIIKSRYFLTFIDDFSRYTWDYFIRKKFEFFYHLKDFNAILETDIGKKMKILCTKNLGEYIKKYVHNICHEDGIHLQHKVPYTPQHNGVPEWKKISLKKMTNCMLHVRYLPSNNWDEALNYDAYIHNIFPHRYFEDITPFEAWIDEKMDVTHFHIFRSHAWAHIPY